MDLQAMKERYISAGKGSTTSASKGRTRFVAGATALGGEAPKEGRLQCCGGFPSKLNKGADRHHTWCPVLLLRQNPERGMHGVPILPPALEHLSDLVDNTDDHVLYQVRPSKLVATRYPVDPDRVSENHPFLTQLVDVRKLDGKTATPALPQKPSTAGLFPMTLDAVPAWASQALQGSVGGSLGLYELKEEVDELSEHQPIKTHTPRTSQGDTLGPPSSSQWFFTAQFGEGEARGFSTDQRERQPQQHHHRQQHDKRPRHPQQKQTRPPQDSGAFGFKASEKTRRDPGHVRGGHGPGREACVSKGSAAMLLEEGLVSPSRRYPPPRPTQFSQAVSNPEPGPAARTRFAASPSIAVSHWPEELMSRPQVARPFTSPATNHASGRSFRDAMLRDTSLFLAKSDRQQQAGGDGVRQGAGPERGEHSPAASLPLRVPSSRRNQGLRAHLATSEGWTRPLSPTWQRHQHPQEPMPGGDCSDLPGFEGSTPRDAHFELGALPENEMEVHNDSHAPSSQRKPRSKPSRRSCNCASHGDLLGDALDLIDVTSSSMHERDSPTRRSKTLANKHESWCLQYDASSADQESPVHAPSDQPDSKTVKKKEKPRPRTKSEIPRYMQVRPRTFKGEEKPNERDLLSIFPPNDLRERYRQLQVQICLRGLGSAAGVDRVSRQPRPSRQEVMFRMMRLPQHTR
mmetsp:Transcript_14273/g.27402  ORF Transcript_14273/g.27402 Transcript_14273/m.27402 type:complete len:687 (+) Transcript_14273:508-2568(+)